MKQWANNTNKISVERITKVNEKPNSYANFATWMKDFLPLSAC